MPGLMSSSISLTICKADKNGPLNMDRLRACAFTDAIDPDGVKFGWVGLGDLLDVENFSLALCDGRFAAFSFRLDMRKPSSAVARLQLAEKIRQEEAGGGRVSGKRKKELREAIIAQLTSEAKFAPALTDCLWDGEKGELLICSTSEKIVERILNHFKTTFGIIATPVEPQAEMAEVFSVIQRESGIEAAGFTARPFGSASLAAIGENDEKSAIITQNNEDAVSQALNDGLSINKMSLVATNLQNEDEELKFSLDASLRICGLRLPKAEKGADEEATFLINAETCAQTVQIAETLAQIA